MQRYFGLSQDTAGSIIPSVSVTVNLAGTGTLATIYSSNTYAALANPFTSDSDGTYEFYAANGRYDIVLAKAGFTFPATNSADLVLFDAASILSPPQITSTQNDYNPTNGADVSIWRLSSDATRSITGIVAGKTGQTLKILNVGSFAITLADQNIGSAAANRIITGSGADLSIAANGAADLVYDNVTQRWRIDNALSGTAITSVFMSPGTRTGLTVSNNAIDATNDWDIAGGATSSDDAVLANRDSLSLTTALTKQADVNWAVGTNQGSLDTGVIANNTYHMFLIKRTDTGVVDVLTSLSPTAPSLPANYDKQKRIFSFYRTGGVNVPIHQFNREIWLDTPVADFNGTVAATTVQTLTLSVPTGLSFTAITNWMSNGNQIVYVKPTTATDSAPTAAAAPGVTVGAAAGPLTEAPVRIPTDTSGQINYRSNSTVVTLTEITLGWVDNAAWDA